MSGTMQDDLSAPPGQRSKAVINPNARLHVDAEVVFEAKYSLAPSACGTSIGPDVSNCMPNTGQGTTSIDLTGWKLRDRAGGQASLSDQLAADASKTVIIPRSLALNNKGDEVALIGNDGIERHRISYSDNQVLPGQEIRF